MANKKTKMAVLASVVVMLVLAMVMSVSMFAGSNSTAYIPDSDIKLDNTAVSASTDAPLEDGQVPADYQPDASATGISDISEARNNPGGNLYLTKDITVSSLSVYTNSNGGNFWGVLDGNGKTITIDIPATTGNESYIGGLFAQLNGTIKNATINIKNISYGSTSGGLSIGGGNIAVDLGGLVGIVWENSVFENIKINIQTTATLGSGANGGQNAWLYNPSPIQQKENWYMAVGGLAGEIRGGKFNNITINNNATGAGVSVCTWHKRGSAGIFQGDYLCPAMYVGGMIGMVENSNSAPSLNNITLMGEGVVRAQDERNDGGTDQYVGGLIGANWKSSWAINGLIYDYSTASLKNSNIDVKGGKNDVTSGLASFNDSSAKLGHFIAHPNGMTFSNVFVANTRTLGYVTGDTNTGWSFPTYDPSWTPKFDGNDNIAFYALKRTTYDDLNLVSQIQIGNDIVNVLDQTIIKDGESAGTVWISIPKNTTSYNFAKTLASRYSLDLPSGVSEKDGKFIASREYNGNVPTIIGSSADQVYSGATSANVGTYTLTWDMAAAGYARNTYNGNVYYIKTIGDMPAIFTATYDVTKPIECTVTPKTVSAVWSADTYVYSGKGQWPTATVTDINGIESKPAVNITSPSDYVNVNEGYKVSISKDALGSNYVIANNEHTFSITPMVLDGTISIVGDNVYDGTQKNVEFKLTSGQLFNGDAIAITYGENADRTNAGTFDVTVQVPSDNYVFAESVETQAQMTIAQRQINVALAGSEFGKEYDGVAFDDFASLFVVSNIVEGEEVVLTYSAGEEVLNAKTYTITASLPAEYTNYTLAGETSASYTITARQLTASFVDAQSYVYTGSAIAPTYEVSGLLEGDEVVATISGDKVTKGQSINAGSYTLTLTAPQNYAFANANTYGYAITQATTNDLNLDAFEGWSGWVYGQANVPTATADFGEVVYRYKQASGDGYETIEQPANAGEYRLVLSVAGTDNYVGIEDYVIDFAITKATPAVEVAVSGTLEEGTLLSAVTITNNAEDKVAGTIAWDNAEYALKAGANECAWTFTPEDTANYEVVNGTYTITAAKAGVKTISAEFVDGKKNYTAGDVFNKEDIEVRAYYNDELSESEVVTDYIVDVQQVWMDTTVITVTYGTCEYELKINEDYTVEKAVVEVPSIKPTTYNGELQKADIQDTDYYTVIENNGGKDAGNYNVVLGLKDAGNYKWSDGSEEEQKTLTFVIAKVLVSVSVNPDQEFVYDGTQKVFVIPENDLYTISGNTATNAGDYTATVELVDSTNYEWQSSTTTFKWTIEKKDATITVNAIDKIYGQEIGEASAQVTGTVNNEELEYTVAIEQANEYVVGTYDITVTLKEGSTVNANYNITINNAQLTIAKASNKINGSLTIAGWTYGESANSHSTVTADFGEVVYTFEGTNGTEYSSSEVPTNAGSYKLVASVEGTANYDGASVFVTFSIAKATVNVPVVEDQTFTYNDSEQVFVIADSELYTVSGNKATNAGDYTANLTLNDTANYVWAEDAKTSYEWSIAKADKDLDISVVLGMNTITITCADFEGVEYSINGGEFTAFNKAQFAVAVELMAQYTVDFKWAESANYNAGSEQVKLTITKKILGEYINAQMSGEFTFADIAKYDELTELAQVATGEDAEFDSAYADLTAKKTALLEGAKADVEEALTAGAKLAGYEVAVAVAMTLTTLGAGIAMATMAMRRKGGKKND